MCPSMAAGPSEAAQGVASMTIIGPELVVLILVIVFLLFGARKIPELARAIGRARGEFEVGKHEADVQVATARGKAAKQARSSSSDDAPEDRPKPKKRPDESDE